MTRSLKSLTTLVLIAASMFTAKVSANTPDTVKRNVIALDASKADFKEAGGLPKILKEASGLEKTKGGYLWSHNDGGVPALYCLDSAGNLVRAVQINATNRGWEDLTQDGEGNFYIGGFGNNKNDKKELRIYKIPNPETIDAPVTNPEIISYSYEDQKVFPAERQNKNFDVDAMVFLKGSLYLFTKDRSSPFKGTSKVYRLSAEPGKQTATLIDSIFVGKGSPINNWITAADISPDGKTLALLLHDRILFVRDFTANNFSKGKIYELQLNHFSHKAGLCWTGDTTLYIVDELEFDILGGKMYRLDVTKLWKQHRF